ncbi:MAG TPA: DUF3090 family protein [Aggregatilineales bacterium]|nr:DUF3090 family protein [Anaerolineales bacterium]HRE46914.1 DUF3090 family protein [Aggregatilineales bacterium]
MTELLLIRHAVNDYVKTGKLAGWTPDVHLNEHGKAQAIALGERLKDTALDALYSSPLERCQETAQAVLDHHPHVALTLLADVGEVRFGAWQGGELRKLAGRKLWRAVQVYPSRVRFPDGETDETKGETIRWAQLRAVDALEGIMARHPRQRVAVVSHSDLIKLILAHYLGMHLDLFQRIDISPASLSVIRLTPNGRPMILQMNETAYLPEPRPDANDERQISVVRPVVHLALEAVGKPGNRVFYLQAAGETEETKTPLTFLLEKTQAAQLADQIDGFVGGVAGEWVFSPLAPIEKIMFRIGRFMLDYDSESALIILRVEEMLGEGGGVPRQVALWTTAETLFALATQARAVVQRGRA